jgi:hypothetical protein
VRALAHVLVVCRRGRVGGAHADFHADSTLYTRVCVQVGTSARLSSSSCPAHRTAGRRGRRKPINCSRHTHSRSCQRRSLPTSFRCSRSATKTRTTTSALLGSSRRTSLKSRTQPTACATISNSSWLPGTPRTSPAQRSGFAQLRHGRRDRRPHRCASQARSHFTLMHSTAIAFRPCAHTRARLPRAQAHVRVRAQRCTRLPKRAHQPGALLRLFLERLA